MFWAIWARPKIQLHLVPLQNILCLHKNCTYQMEIIFWSGTKSLTSPKYFGTSRADGRGRFWFSMKLTKIGKNFPVSSMFVVFLDFKGGVFYLVFRPETTS